MLSTPYGMEGQGYKYHTPIRSTLIILEGMFRQLRQRLIVIDMAHGAYCDGKGL